MTEYSRDLPSRSTLHPGDMLYSGTRAFRLAMQPDGNLVLQVIDDATLPLDISKGKYVPIWATFTNGEGVVRAEMQADGNLVLYDKDANPRWHSRSAGSFGSFLRCQDDGNLVIYDPSGRFVWASNTQAVSR